MLVNSTRTQFFEDYWRHLRAEHPQLLMKKPSPKGSNSNWVKFKGQHFPKGVLLTHKIDQCVMELGFARTSAEDLQTVLPELRPSAIIGQRGKTAVVQIDVPKIDKEIAFSQQVEAVEIAINAAYQLYPLGGIFSQQSA